MCFCFTKTCPVHSGQVALLPMVANNEGKMENEKRFKKSKGGRPAKAVRRESHIRVRLTKTEYFLIEEKSKKAGITISEWFRKAAVKGKVLVRMSPEDIKVLRVLAGMANNLNQLTKLAHQQGLLSVQRKCRELLSALDDTLKYLNRDDR